jgi:hypothetical protein
MTSPFSTAYKPAITLPNKRGSKSAESRARRLQSTDPEVVKWAKNPSPQIRRAEPK